MAAVERTLRELNGLGRPGARPYARWPTARAKPARKK